MKIAFVVRNYNKRGGVSGYTATLAEQFCSDNEVHIFAVTIGDAPVNTVKHIVPAFNVPYLYKIKKHSWNVALEIPSFLKNSEKAVDYQQYDIVHSQGDFKGKCDIYTAHSCHKAWLSLAVKNRTGWLDGIKKSPLNPLHYWILKAEYYGVKKSKRIIAISEAVKKELIEFYPFTAGKIEVIYNGVDTARYDLTKAGEWRRTIRERHALKANDFVAVFPAHEFRRKGLIQLIEAFSILKRYNLYLLVVGRDDPAEYISMIEKKGLSKNIIFAGERADMEKYYAAADVMVFPTLYEPFGLVVTEAMASGVPVIVSAVAGAAELIEDGVNGLLLKDRNDAGEIAAKIGLLRDNSEYRADIIKKAKVTAEEYSWNKVSIKINILYQTVLEEKRKCFGWPPPPCKTEPKPVLTEARGREGFIKICMFARSLLAHAMGGMELHIETLSRELVKLGLDVTIITTGHPAGREFEDKDNVKIYYLKGTMPGKYSSAYFAQSARLFIELDKSEKYNLIHSQSSGAYYILKNGLNKRRDIPIVVSLHGTTIDEIKTKLRLGFNLRGILSLIKNTYNYMFRDKKYLNACDAVIATSDSQVEVIKKYYGIDAQKITLVYNGIDNILFSPRPASEDDYKKYGVNRGDPVIVSCARLKKEKGLQNIISILPRLKEKVPDVKLLIAGAGEYAPALRGLIKELKMEDTVKMLGQIEYLRLPELMNICSVFVNSTIRENGYDLTIPQAMACAKPVVASDIRSVMSVIESGRTGYIYKRNDLAELESLVAKLLLDGQLRDNIGASARIAAQQRFSLRNMAENTVKLYKRLLEKRK